MRSSDFATALRRPRLPGAKRGAMLASVRWPMNARRRAPTPETAANSWLSTRRLAARLSISASTSVGAPIIPELAARVWVRSDRPGVALLARVVFPRTIDPQTRAPVVTFVPGTVYDQVESWQQLSLDNFPTVDCPPDTRASNAIERSARPARSVRRPVAVERLFRGRPQPSLDRRPRNRGNGATAGRSAGDWPRRRRTEAAKPQPVELNGSVLMVEGRPFFPRMIRHQGEPLRVLRELGFNCVRFATNSVAPNCWPKPSNLAWRWFARRRVRRGSKNHRRREFIAAPPLVRNSAAWSPGMWVEHLTSRDLPVTAALGRTDPPG